MATIIDTQYIKQIAATIVDARLLQLREAIYGPGVTYANFIPISSLPPTVVNGDLDELVGDYGYIKYIKVYSGGTFKGDVTELDFLNASVLVAGNRAMITISGRGIIDAGVNNNTPYSNVGHLDFQVAGGALMTLGSSYDSGTNKATIVFDITPHQIVEATYESLGHVIIGSGLIVNDSGVVRVDPAVFPSGLTNPMTSVGDIIYGGTLGSPLRRGIGASGQVLTVQGGVPVWESAQTVIGSGVAPTDAKYIVSQAHAGLSQEIVIPGLAGSPDIQGTYGGGTEYEFDSGTSPFTWNYAPLVEDINSTIKSHIYFEIDSYNSNPDNRNISWTSWSPAGDFDIRMKGTVGGPKFHSGGGSVGLQLYNSDNSRRVLIYLIDVGNTAYVDTFSYSSSAYTELSGTKYAGPSYRYMRIKRVGSTIYFYQSFDGLMWQYMNETTFTLTVARMGVYLSTGNGASGVVSPSAIDWIRANV